MLEVGQKVITKSWEELYKEFTPDSVNPHNGWEDRGGRFFHKDMKQYCGCVCTIRKVSKRYCAYILDNGWTWHESWVTQLPEGEE